MMMEQLLAKFVGRYLEDSQGTEIPMQKFMLKLILRDSAFLVIFVTKYSGPEMP